MSLKLSTSPTPIIPAILTTSPQDFANKLEFARSVGAVHLDVIDGRFCAGEALAVDKWPELAIKYAEAHLMVVNPLDYLEAVAAKGVSRAIVHIESTFSQAELEQTARELDILLGYAINPDTDLLLAKHFVETNAHIQIMGVDPGQSGQSMYPQTPLAVSYLLKTTNRRLQISVDGGVNAETVGQLLTAGASYFVEGHAVFYRRPYQENYDAMLEIVRAHAK